MNRLMSGMVMVGLMSGQALAATWTVAPTGSDSTGTGSAGAPWATISNAVAKAVNDDTIVVNSGTYFLKAPISVNKRLTINGASGNPADVVVDGSNAVTCFNVSSNLLMQYLTIQHGSNSASATAGGVYVSGGVGTTIRACYIINNYEGNAGAAVRSSRPLTLDACTISGNVGAGQGAVFVSAAGCSHLITNCTFASNAMANGGALEFASVVQTSLVANCTFINNTNTTTATYGAGLWMDLNCIGTVVNCAFVGNTIPGASGRGAAAQFCNGVMTGCGFTNNSCSLGGALAMLTGASGMVANCSFTANFSWGGGGAGFVYDGNFSNCTFAGNWTTNGDGGALRFWTGSRSKLVTGCAFSNNSASAFGGGVSLSTSSGLLQNCTFAGNVATNGYGGGCAAAGFWTIRNSGFLGNQAKTYGGGCYVGYSNNVLDSCTFAANAVGTANGGGGWYQYNNYTRNYYTNCIAFSNVANGVKNDVVICATTTNIFDHCCLMTNGIGGYAASTFINCITNDPVFVNAGVGTGTNLLLGAYDFRLQKTSPCKDAGVNEDWMVGASDVAGNARIVNALVDLGCFEYQIPAAAGPRVLFW